ncbi:hypothetical protein ACFUTX_15705 [Microbacterium sp. NPDC057407]|uniref:hypothetical protein n=1 Tax=Microbacterium sp. NPDC057407 TaxID=3346120 RepID=UPI00366CE99F
MTRTVRTDVISAVVLAAVAVVVLLVGDGKPWLGLPVTATFVRPPEAPTGSPVELATAEASVSLAVVQLPDAVAMLLLFLAGLRALSLVAAVRARRHRAMHADRHTTRWIEYSQVGGVVTFLVAQLNGITAVTSLVPLYALGAAGGMLLWLHDRRTATGRAGLWAFGFGAAIAVVPWGVIAFAQVGGGLVEVGPGILIRIVTIAALLALATVWVGVWVLGRGERTPEIGTRVDRMLALTIPLAPIVLAVGVAVG